MTDKELIKQEIERRIAEGSSKNDISEGALALESLLDFIDNLQKESGCEADCTTIDKDLEAEIQRYFSEEKWIEKPVAEIAIHFADWQHGKDFDDLLQSEMKFPKEYYERGRADMREEMMKDAQLGIIEECADGLLAWNTMYGTDKDYRNYLLSHFKNGDKVKLIIIKEEQQ